MIKRKIALMLTLFTLAAPAAQASEINVHKSKAAVTAEVSVHKNDSDKLKNMLGIKGKVIKVTKEKNKVTAYIKGESLTEKGYNEVKLVINNGTKIVDEKSNKKLSLTDIEEGMVVKAYFAPKATKSIPPIVQAKEITVIGKYDSVEFSVAEGNIVDVNETKGGIMALVQEKNTENPLNGQINLTIGDKTEIVNEEGKKLNIKEIKKGVKIKAYYGPVVTMSIPPMSQASKIIVLKEKDNALELPVTEGNIVDISKIKDDIMINVQEKDTEIPMYGQIRLSINAETEIIDEENGKKLTINDIKDGMRVKAYYGPATTMSIPPQSYAKKVIVVKDEHKNLYEVECSIVDTFKFEDGLMAYVKAERESFFAFISEYSQIINEEDGKELDIKDINKDTKIKLCFNQRNGLVHLRNYLPTMCLAEKVVVMGDVEEKLISTEGKIVQILNGKDGMMALVDGEKLSEYGYNKINLTINKDTEIINGIDGTKLSYDDIKKNTRVIGFYGPAVTRSLPPMATAKKIIVITDEKDDISCTQGEVKQIFNVKDGKRILVEGKKSTKYGYDKIELNINEDTKIFKENGTELSYDELKNGIKVKAYYGPKVTRSLPPIGTANVIIVEDK